MVHFEKKQASCQKSNLILFFCCLLIILGGCRANSVAPEEVTPASILKEVPETPREFRGVWVATVANIDWPSQPGLPAAEQKAEMRALLDRAASLNLNAIILQVRPSADALYDSKYEPWSEYLTGKQGRAPEPFYDPLKYAIEQAHNRGLQLHAWFNPFRAYHPAAKNGLAPGHVKNTHPEWVVPYGDYYWLDPGQIDARQYTIKVILDVVQRYDIDGVHLDDYFYPYPAANARGETIPFPDENSYQNYLKNHVYLNKGDWRRQNVNNFVKRLSENIKKTDPNVVFGISPFGIWRPGNPAQIVGFDAYAEIYADSRKWIRKGWVDYLAPQLYWPIGQTGQSFPVLLNWWSGQNLKDRHIWPGLFTSGVGYFNNGWPSSEIENQIQITQNTPDVTGHIHFSMQALMNNSGNISTNLMEGKYKMPAVVPSMPWISTNRPPKPEAALKDLGSKLQIILEPITNDKPWLWVVKIKYKHAWLIHIIPGRKNNIEVPQDAKNGTFVAAVITTVNRMGNESEARLLMKAN